MRRWKAHRGKIASLSFSRDGQFLAAIVDGERGVTVWNTLGGEVVRVVDGPSDSVPQRGTVGAAAFAPGADYLALANHDAITVWETNTWSLATSTPDPFHDFQIRQLAWDPGLTPAIAVSGRSQEVSTEGYDDEGLSFEYELDQREWSRTEVWSLPASMSPRFRLSLVADWTKWAVCPMSFSADGFFLGQNGRFQVEVWNAWAGVLAWTLDHEPTDDAGPICFSPNSSSLAFAGGPRIWACRSGTTTAASRIELAGHTDKVWTLRYTPDGRTLISASSDGTVRLWEASTGLEKRCFDMKIGKIAAADVSPDGAVAAVGGANGEIVVFDLE